MAREAVGFTIPHRPLWSLLDMLRHYEPLFLTVMLQLFNIHVDWVSGVCGDEEFRSKLAVALRDVKREAERAHLRSIADEADILLTRWIPADSVDAKTLIAFSMNFVGSVQRELANHLFYRIPKEWIPYFKGLLVTEPLESAFPSAAKELKAASRCLAVDQPTASVMHSMRALETGLAALVAELGFTPSSQNWETVLNECEREIRKLPQTKPTATWKKDETFFSEAATDFRHFKNAWRNHAMHGRESYDHTEASNIFLKVLSFSNHLGARLSETA
jgi:hypothetical protein